MFMTQVQRRTATVFVASVTEKEMERVIKSLNKKASAGCDDVPVLVLKQCMDYIMKPLVNICNIFPIWNFSRADEDSKDKTSL